MPVKNATPFLKECIDSILSQSFLDWELLAVDDGSTDDSYEVLKYFASKDSRIFVFKNIGKGIINALRVAANNSHGDKITRMDADDIMPKEKLGELSRILDENGQGTLATGKVKYFSNEILGDGFKRYEKWLNKLCETDKHFDHIYFECVIPSPCWMVFAEDFNSCGGFQVDRYPEDYDLCFRYYQKKLTVVSSQKVLHLWRDSPNRASRIDPNYSDHTFLELKVDYFVQLDYKNKQNLVIWGAGKKGKRLAKIFSTKDIPFYWICNNQKKIGQSIYNVELKPVEQICSMIDPMILICVSSPEEVEEITVYMNEKSFKFRENYLFFC